MEKALRIATAAGFYWLSLVGASAIFGVVDVFVLGHYDDKWGSQVDNFTLIVSVFGFYLGLATAPFFAAVMWLALRKEVFEDTRFWLLAPCAGIAVTSLALIS
jgi:hypothetical protein